VIKEDKSDSFASGEPKHLDTNLLQTSELAIQQSIKEMQEMLILVKKSLELSMDSFLNNNYKNLDKIGKVENAIDHLQKEITLYLVAVNENSKSKLIAKKIPSLLHVVNDIEKLGDFAEQINEVLNNQITSNKSTFYPDFLEIIANKHQTVLYLLDLCIKYLDDLDDDISKKILELVDRMNHQHKDLRKQIHHMIQTAVCDAASGLNTIDYIDTLDVFVNKSVNIVREGKNKFIYIPLERPKLERMLNGE